MAVMDTLDEEGDVTPESSNNGGAGYPARAASPSSRDANAVTPDPTNSPTRLLSSNSSNAETKINKHQDRKALRPLGNPSEKVSGQERFLQMMKGTYNRTPLTQPGFDTNPRTGCEPVRASDLTPAIGFVPSSLTAPYQGPYGATTASGVFGNIPQMSHNGTRMPRSFFIFHDISLNPFLIQLAISLDCVHRLTCTEAFGTPYHFPSAPEQQAPSFYPLAQGEGSMFPLNNPQKGSGSRASAWSDAKCLTDPAEPLADDSAYKLQGQTPMAFLSQECQKRGFNPKFIEESINGIHFTCSVEFQDTTITSYTKYPTAYEAKRAMAKRALAEVRKLPVPNGDLVAAEKAAKAAAIRNRQMWSSRHNGETRDADGPAQKSNDGVQQPTTITDCSKSGRILQEIQSLHGTTAVPGYVIANQEASRAFLEGFALGAQLRDLSRGTFPLGLGSLGAQMPSTERPATRGTGQGRGRGRESSPKRRDGGLPRERGRDRETSPVRRGGRPIRDRSAQHSRSPHREWLGREGRPRSPSRK